MAAVQGPAGLKKQLRSCADPQKARVLQRFFKTAPGEYAEGDKFLGVVVPSIRQVAKDNRDASLEQVGALLRSPWHEERLLALIIMTLQYPRASPGYRTKLFDLYLDNTRFINNWDLVDLSAPHLVGEHLRERSRRLLYRLCRSSSLWERRISIVSTFCFIRRGDFDDTLALSRELCQDKEDLIHKAVGWMLREVGKRDKKRLEEFLSLHAARLPRTSLRYCLERFPPQERARWMRTPRIIPVDMG